MNSRKGDIRAILTHGITRLSGSGNPKLIRRQIIFVVLVLIGLFWFYGSSARPSVTLPSSDIVAGTASPAHPIQKPSSGTETPPAPVNGLQNPAVNKPATDKAFHEVHYTVESGDTLEAIFAKEKLPITELYEILEADEPYLVIDVLQPGDQLTFRLDDKNSLTALSLVVDPSKTVIYQRADDGHFVYKEKLTPTTLVTDVVRGEVDGSFYTAARKAGLSDKTVMTISQLFKSKLDFRRDLRVGDRFQAVVERETIDGKPIGHNRLLAVRFNLHRSEFGAYLYSDGSYYDANGDSLTPALLRYPTRKRFRVSSPFSPRRLNPVTGRYAPHNGVDFAMPIGTPVVATGVGRVTRVATHRYAGRYVVIDEFGPYSTRYLHLSKILVHKGQHVERGQVIGLSGNTGRSTGPHLHYELHIKGKAVNPITANIPMLKSIPAARIADFRKQVQTLQGRMAGRTLLAKSSTGQQTPKPGTDNHKTE